MGLSLWQDGLDCEEMYFFKENIGAIADIL